jgi:hypothetical protein
VTDRGGLTDQDGAAADAVNAALRREVYELSEEAAELRSKLTTRVNSARIHELELASARQDLEVKAAYNVMLERAALERQADIAHLHAHIASLSAISAQVAPAVERAATSEAGLAQEQTRADDAERRLLDLTARMLITERELAAFRRRTSTLVAERMAQRFHRHGLLYRFGQRALRALARG